MRKLDFEKCVDCGGEVFVKYPPDMDSDPRVLRCANIDCRPGKQKRRVVVPSERTSCYKIIFDRSEY